MNKSSNPVKSVKSQAIAVGAAALTAIFSQDASSQTISPEGYLDRETAADLTYRADPEWRVMVEGNITTKLAETVRSKLYALANKDSARPIVMEINSGGGDVVAGWTIRNAVNAIPNRVDMVAERAESMAAIILAGNKAGYRYAYPHSRIMLHSPWINPSGSMNNLSAVQNAQDIASTVGYFTNVISEVSGLPEKAAQQLIENGDTILPASEAYRLNIIDAVIPDVEKVQRPARSPAPSEEFCAVSARYHHVCEVSVSGTGRPGTSSPAPAARLKNEVQARSPGINAP